MSQRVRRLFAWTLVVGSWVVFQVANQVASGADWPFNPVKKPVVPRVGDVDWVQNPVDAFVLEKLEEKTLRPNRPHDKLGLLKRLTNDLTGLLPTSEEQATFLADDSPDAYLRLIDRLLDSPRFGERWAQHWLDLVRYAETDGFKSDGMRPNAHKYRDYVIQSLNRDLPYDRFIRQQLAGDELEPDNPEAIIATGLNRLYPDELQASNIVLRRQEYLDDVTEVTGLVFFGLTIGCAKCHDHKFDPISQADFFRLQAFFSPMVPRDDLTTASPEEDRKFREQMTAWEQATGGLRAKMDTLLEPLRTKRMASLVEPYEPVVLEALNTPPQRRSAMQEQLTVQVMKWVMPRIRSVENRLEGETLSQYETLKQQLASFDHLKPNPHPPVMGVVDTSLPPPPTHRLATGNYLRPLEEVRPGFPKFLESQDPSITPPSRRPSSTGRRTALANWLTKADHPLTARLIVNRLWQYHFGEGIVSSANDWGLMGTKPTHPELLDWLAAELVEHDWSLKHIHRLIVSSQTYQQSSDVDEDQPLHKRALAVDPHNKLMWHFDRQRLEGETIRDMLLQVSGNLNLRMYGPSAKPALPIALESRYTWDPDEKDHDRNRRAVFVLAKRNLREPLMDAFDMPDMHNSCARRTSTITAPQALTLLNGEFSFDQARKWAGDLLTRFRDDRELIRSAYREAFARPATATEVELARRFIVSQAEGMTTSEWRLALQPTPLPHGCDPARAAAVLDFCHALLNANEFLFVE